MARGNKQAVALGPGKLFGAILGSDEPENLTDDWDTAWFLFGYTKDGSTQSYSASYEDVEVAEELDPVDSVPTGRVIKVAFDAAENTADNYKRMMNGGTITLLGTTPDQVVKFEPPDLGDEVKIMIGFESEDGKERWVWRECKQTGNSETARKKGADIATIPMEFTCYKPDEDTKPFMRLSNRGTEVADAT